jgi:hypothetical protein
MADWLSGTIGRRPPKTAPPSEFDSRRTSGIVALADHQLRTGRVERGGKSGSQPVVLAVRVERDHGVGAHLERVPEPGAERSARRWGPV